VAGSPTKIDKAWEQLFNQHNILSQINAEGSFRIASSQINKVHEARLMAKFDKSANLPQIFRENKLSILPVTRGEYIIGPFITHEPIQYQPVKPKQVENPRLETLKPDDLYNEASALFFAYNSGIIQDVMGSNDVKLTVGSRMGSGAFSFSVQNKLKPQNPATIEVKNSQIEIDAGFESPEQFLICEAKNQAPSELLIRQLYYPYRLWSEKITKPVSAALLAFSNDIFHVFTYAFEDKKNYNSIALKKYSAYTFADEDIIIQDIVEVWQNTVVGTEPNVTFPQADSFPRVLDLLSVLHGEDLTRSEVTLKYEFDPRQTNYYVSACEYLGFIERFATSDHERGYRLTTDARQIMSLPYKQKHLSLIRAMLKNPVFYRAFEVFTRTNSLPDKRMICQIMQETDFPKPINATTIDRRSSTVSGWLDWMFRLAVAE
jgi:hypothetical protein